MEENDIRFGEFLTSLFGNADVDVFVEGGIDESNIVVADDFDQFFSGAGEFLWSAFATLEPDLDSVVIFVEFDLGLADVGRLFDLLEEMLTV